MTPAQFALTYRQTANAVSQGTGIDPLVLLAQWGVETAWGNSIFNSCNLGNIRCLSSVPCAGGFAQFPTFASFVINCIAVWHNGAYGGVLAAPDPPAQLAAIGFSPWDAGHYNNGGGPGSSLIAAYHLLGGDMWTDAQINQALADLATIKREFTGPLADDLTIDARLATLRKNIAADVVAALAALPSGSSGLTQQQVQDAVTAALHGLTLKAT